MQVNDLVYKENTKCSLPRFQCLGATLYECCLIESSAGDPVNVLIQDETNKIIQLKQQLSVKTGNALRHCSGPQTLDVD